MIKDFGKTAVFVTHMRGLINAAALSILQRRLTDLMCVRNSRQQHLVPWAWMKPQAVRVQMATRAFRSDGCLCLKGGLISPEKAGCISHAECLQFPNKGM